MVNYLQYIIFCILRGSNILQCILQNYHKMINFHVGELLLIDSVQAFFIWPIPECSKLVAHFTSW